ncbi:MAG: amidohydrolase, partial [Chloroflexi bacterium]
MMSLSLSQICAEAEAMRDSLIAVRRDLHQHPELAFQEVRTAGIVAERLRALGYAVQTGIGRTGVVGLLKGTGATDRPLTLMLRFDMDALPIQEAVDVPFKSQYPGKMHACGHDAHTAIGLGVAELLARHRDQWGGVAKFVFQPAEEVVGGALAMIHDGVLADPAPDRVLAMHVWATEAVGTVGVTDGPTLAASATCRIAVRGRGAHGAAPHLSADPIVAAAHIITALQTIVARNVDPMAQGVVTVGCIHGGAAPNVIPDVVELQGTLRAFEESVMQLMRVRVQQIVAQVAAGLGVEAAVTFAEPSTPATVNDPALARLVRETAAALVGPQRVRSDYRIMATEDCAF